MNDFLNHPTLVLVLSLPAFWFSGWLGARFRKKRVDLEESTRSDLTSVTSGALTLLGLIIGFTFSMAVSRYHQRKNYEVAETNAIGTEYARADFLPVTETARLRALLRAISISASCATALAAKSRYARSKPGLLNCRPRCGRLSQRPLQRRLSRFS